MDWCCYCHLVMIHIDLKNAKCYKKMFHYCTENYLYIHKCFLHYYLKSYCPRLCIQNKTTSNTYFDIYVNDGLTYTSVQLFTSNKE